MTATEQERQRLLEAAARLGDALPTAPETEAEEDALLTISAVRAGRDVSKHEVDAALGYVETLLARS